MKTIHEEWYVTTDTHGKDVEFCIEMPDRTYDGQPSEVREKAIREICTMNNWYLEDVEDSPYRHDDN